MSKITDRLMVVVQDLLCELRIDEHCLETMANGYAPDYPGAIDLRRDEVWENPHCKVQLSKVVAQKLIGAGVIAHVGGEKLRETNELQGAEEFLELLLCLPSERLGEIIEECEGYVKSRAERLYPHETDLAIEVQARLAVQKVMKAVYRLKRKGKTDV